MCPSKFQNLHLEIPTLYKVVLEDKDDENFFHANQPTNEVVLDPPPGLSIPHGSVVGPSFKPDRINRNMSPHIRWV